MSFQLIGAGSDLSSTQTQMNKNILELKNNETTTIFKDDTGTRRVLLGKGADGFYGVKVSPENIDVLTAENDELVFNSNQKVFKIVGTGTTSLPYITTGIPGAGNYDTASQEVVVPHSLGYTPMVFAFMGDGTYRYPLPYVSNAGSGTAARWLTIDIYIDSSNVRFLQTLVAAGTAGANMSEKTISYYLLQETAD